MKLTKRNSVIASLAAVGALAIGGVAIAATSGDDRASDLAEALSAQTGTEITADDVIAAQKQVMTDRIEERVADGSLTREQADEMIERIESGDMPGRGFGHGGHGQGGFDRGNRGGGPLADVAEQLGLDADAFVEAVRDGQTPAEYAESEGVSRADLIAAITDSITERAAERGLGAPDADRIAEMAESIADGERRGGPGMGGRGMHPHSTWGGSVGDPASEDATATS